MSTGLRYSFEAPNTADGDYAVEMVGRGDISGSSFAFRAKDSDTEWVKEGNLWVRTIKRFSLLRDVTITTDPCLYSKTLVTLEAFLEERCYINPIEEDNP